MGDNRLTFERLPKQDNDPHVLGSLVFDKRDELGPAAFFDLRKIGVYEPLARDLIATLYELAKPDRIASDSSINIYYQSIRHFLDYCRQLAIPASFKMRDISFECLLDYRAHLRLTGTEFKSNRRRRLYGRLLNLIQAGQSIGLAHIDLTPPRNFASANDSDVTQPYTTGEALDFEDACRTHIRQTVARLEQGKKLLLEGKNPKGIKPNRNPVTGQYLKQPLFERAWNQLPNLLWYVVHEMDGKFLKRDELLSNGHASFNYSLTGGWGGLYRKKDVYSHLYPLAEDLIPFIILLAKKTGRNESSIFSLRRDCVQQIGERYFMWYQKPRGGARLYKKAIESDGEFSPVALLNLLKEITEPLVRHAAPIDQEKLFLGLTVQARGSDPVKRLDESYIKDQMNRAGGWCDQHALVNEHGIPLKVSLRSWRVYYLTNRYKKRGQLSKISRDAAHILSSTSVGYVANDHTKHLHEKAIEAGILSARSLAVLSVVAHNNSKMVAAELKIKEETAEKILKGKQDVFFASCRDFYNRPGGLSNTPCDKPWGCFTCSNAIITRHVLPRVLAFRDFMVQQRSELSSEDWSTKFGQTWKIITHDVLPKFSSDTLSEAERCMRNEVLYIPLALKV